MTESFYPDVTPEKIYPFLRKADPDQLGTLYRLSHHMICGSVPPDVPVSAEDILGLFRDGSERQRLLIFQAAYHLIQKERMV